MLPQDAGFSWN